MKGMIHQGMLCLVEKGICTMDLPGWPRSVILSFRTSVLALSITTLQKTDEKPALRCFLEARCRQCPGGLLHRLSETEWKP